MIKRILVIYTLLNEKAINISWSQYNDKALFLPLKWGMFVAHEVNNTYYMRDN